MRIISTVMSVGGTPLDGDTVCNCYAVIYDDQWHLCYVAGDRLHHYIVQPETDYDLQSLIGILNAREFISAN